MRKILFVTGLALILLLGKDATAMSEAYTGASRVAKLSDARKLIGREVKNPQGKLLGTIDEITAGPDQQGKAAFAIITYEVTSPVKRRVAVPFGALSCGHRNCVIKDNRERLDGAPSFVSTGDLVEPKLADDIYRYFGIEPYWTQAGTER